MPLQQSGGYYNAARADCHPFADRRRVDAIVSSGPIVVSHGWDLAQVALNDSWRTAALAR